MQLYMIRHGESTDDIEDCYGGIADFPLTDRGRQQAREVGAQLSSSGIQAVFSSPLSRARETAMIIADCIGVNAAVTVIDDLQERNSYGVMSGVNKERAKELFGRVLASLKEKPGYSREPLVGAENFDAFVERVRRALDQVIIAAKSAGYSRIAIVTHGKFTQALFGEVLRIEGDVYLDLSAVNLIEYQPAVASLIQR